MYYLHLHFELMYVKQKSVILSEKKNLIRFLQGFYLPFSFSKTKLNLIYSWKTTTMNVAGHSEYLGAPSLARKCKKVIDSTELTRLLFN